jgi:hypothetical protein
MTTYTTANEAIERSISHNEIAYCEDTEENREYLLAESDDYVDAGEVQEFWKNDEDSDTDMEWRVHIRAQKSPLRMPPSNRSATILRTASPVACPWQSLIGLNWFMSTASKPNRVPSRAAPSPCSHTRTCAPWSASVARRS